MALQFPHLYFHSYGGKQSSSNHVSWLVTRMIHFHGEAAYFCHESIMLHNDGEWDEERGEEINADIQMLDAEINDVNRNEYYGIHKSWKMEETRSVIQDKTEVAVVASTPMNTETARLERMLLGNNDADSVATVNTAANQKNDS
jgi:hypothetical protein